MSRFFEPITFGNYPASMRSIVGNRLPKFTAQESKYLLKGSTDFLGLNYYTGNYAEAAPLTTGPNKTYTSDFAATLTGKFSICITI